MQQNPQYTPSHSLLKDQLSQIRLLSNELQAKESENSLLRAELSKLSETCYDFQQKSDSFENRYKFQLEEASLKNSVLFQEIASLKKQKQGLKSQNLEIQQKNLQFVREIAELQREIEGFSQEKHENLREIEALKACCYRWELENEHLTAKIAQKAEIIAKTLKEAQALKGLNENLCRENAQLRDEIKGKAAEIDENRRFYAEFERVSATLREMQENFLIKEQEKLRLCEELEEKQREISEICSELQDCDANLLREKSAFEEKSKEFTQQLSQEREKTLRKEQETQLFSAKLEETLKKLSDLEEDLGSISQQMDATSLKSLQFRSGNLHLSLLKARFAEISQEKHRARKYAKKLGKNQGFLLEDLRNIHGKLLQLGDMAENRDNSQVLAVKTQFEEKLNEIEKAYVDRETRLEAVIREKEQEIAKIVRVLEEHIAIINKKEVEKQQILALLAENAENSRKIERNPAVKQENCENCRENADYCTVLALFSQILARGSEKYEKLAEMKQSFRLFLEYYCKISAKLVSFRVKRAKVAGICVVFCEILFKLWSKRRKTAGNHAKKLDISLKIKENSMICAIPRGSLEIGGEVERLICDIFSKKRDIFENFFEVLAIVCRESRGNKENAAKFKRNTQVLAFITEKHAEKLKTLCENREGWKKNEGFSQKSALLGEENAYIKAKLEEMSQKVENLENENEGLKRLLDDSENKRSILIQNFKELEKHAQNLNEENQNLKNV